MATPQEIRDILSNLADAYPDWKPPSIMATFRQYEQALAAYPASLIERAARRCMDSCVFFPKIAEIKAAIGFLTAQDATNVYKDDGFVKQPMSPETKAMIEAFRSKMIASGKWQSSRKHH